MDTQLLVICILTFVIHLIGTLAYAARIAGVRTRRVADFRWILWSATLATFVGALFIPTFQRVFSRAVLHFQANRSIPRLILRIFFKGGLAQLKDVASMPAAANITQIRAAEGISPWVIALNVAAIALWTTGVFASLYAGYLNRSLRVTSSTLSAVVNGAATILMFVFIDPQMSMMTDDVVEGRTSEPHFRRAVVCSSAVGWLDPCFCN